MGASRMSDSRRRKGSGSITQLADGRWLARFTIPATANRAARRVARKTTSRRAAEDALRDLRRQYAEAPAEAAEALLPRPTLRLDTYIAEVWQPRLEAAVAAPKPRVRARTADEYMRVARRYLLAHDGLGHRRLSTVTPLDVERLCHTLAARGLAPATVRRVAQVARLIAKDAEADGILPRGTADAIRLPSGRRVAEPARLTPEQVDQVVRLLLAEDNVATLPALLVATLGLRRGEACAVRWSSVNLAAGTMTVEHSVTELPDGTLVLGAPKSEAGRRVLPLAPEVVAALSAARRSQPFGVWVGGRGGGQLRPSALSRYLRGAVRRAGVPGRGGAHEFRRSVTDRMLAAGVDPLLASRFLGHGDGGRLVANVYAGRQEDRVLAVGELLFLPQGEAV